MQFGYCGELLTGETGLFCTWAGRLDEEWEKVVMRAGGEGGGLSVMVKEGEGEGGEERVVRG